MDNNINRDVYRDVLNLLQLKQTNEKNSHQKRPNTVNLLAKILGLQSKQNTTNNNCLDRGKKRKNEEYEEDEEPERIPTLTEEEPTTSGLSWAEETTKCTNIDTNVVNELVLVKPNDIDKVSKYVTEIQKRNDEIQKRNVELADSVDTLNTMKNLSEKTHLDEINKLKLDLHQVNEEYGRRDEDVRAQLNDLTNINNNQGRLIEKLNNERDELLLKVGEFTENTASLDETIRAKREQISQLDRDIGRKKEELADKEDYDHNLTTKKRSLDGEVVNLQNRHDYLRAEIEKMENELVETRTVLDSDFSALKRHRVNLEEELAKVNANLAQESRQLELLKQQYTAIDRDEMSKREKFEQQLRDVNRQIGDKHAVLDKLRREETRLGETITNMQAKIDRLVKDERDLVAILEKENKELRDRLAPNNPNTKPAPKTTLEKKVLVEEQPPSKKENFKRKHDDISGKYFI